MKLIEHEGPDEMQIQIAQGGSRGLGLAGSTSWLH